MTQLFEVTTLGYKRYYVMAESYNEAKFKVEKEIAEEDTKKGVLDSEGSLRRKEEPDKVCKIEQLAHKIIS